MAEKAITTFDSTHVVVEIPSPKSPPSPPPNPILDHPLTEISRSSGHLLLLSLHQRAESQLAHSIALREARIDHLKRDAFGLSSLFLAFHAVAFTLTFTASTHSAAVCRNWWVPCSASLATSLVLISAVQARVCGYWRMTRELQRERSDGRAMRRLVQELRMKGSSFDLSKEMVQKQQEDGGKVGKKAAAAAVTKKKSSSVEIEWRFLRVLKENSVTICLVVFAGLVTAASKFTLCF